MYLAFYGLEREPFGLSPDPRFLHLAAPHRAALEAMMESVSCRKGLQVTVGPIGTGKTTLLFCLQHILMHESSRERPVRTAFIVNPILTVMELFEALFDELEVTCPVKTKPACLRALHEILAEGYTKNGTLLLIVDEAHLLPPELIEEIRLLLNLDSYSAPVLQVLLCGQPELLALLARPELAAFRQRISRTSKLRSLTPTETRAYIAERLHIAGLRAEGPFSSAALEVVHRHTEGVPRLINILCDRALTAGFRRQSRKVGPEIIAESASDLEAPEPPPGFADPPSRPAAPVLAQLQSAK